MRKLLVATTAALLLAAPGFAFDWADLASHAGGAEMLDGSGTVVALGWPLCEADLDTRVLGDRLLWLDVLDPAGTLGGGVSLDVVPDGPAAA